MTTNNKILTVSYGTFSCTLEGFDDNFGTMKAIAEYFRDLAGDDRYFGAEPPQPDVEMLARIAEREISRRVKTRKHDGGLVLSAERDPETVQPESGALQATLGAKDTEAHQEPARHKMGVTIDHLEDQTDTLQPNGPKVIEEADINIECAETKTSTADTQSNDSSPALESILTPEGTAEISASGADQFFAQPSAYVQTVSPDTVAQAQSVAASEPPAPDSIAAKLQRIRAVVTRNRDEAEENNIFEDEYAEDFVADTVPDTAAHEPVVADIAQVTADEEKSVLEQAVHAAEAIKAAETAAIDAYESDVENDDMAAARARFGSNDQSAPGEPLTQSQGKVAQVTSEGKSLPRDMPVNSLPEKSPAAEEEEGDAHLLTDSPALDADLEQCREIENDDGRKSTGDAKPQFPRARIIKVKRADIDAAIASGALEEIEDNTEHESEPSDYRTATLDPENSGNTPDKTASDENATIVDTAAQPGVDEDVSRLMAEADSQMEEPEGTSRRSAFAHLKAAVMAKKTDLGIGADAADKDVAYRSDLASVVKPRRTEKAGSAPQAESKRPAPLTLIAEQRIDGGTVPTGPVRPRRVAARDEPTGPETGTSFEDYASERGANDLPGLLEAAASYLSFVEGREQFSRPQLMTKVRQIEKDDFSREDGLRSFGQLLRAGKIEKIKGGRFTVTDDIGYQPDQRAAG